MRHVAGFPLRGLDGCFGHLSGNLCAPGAEFFGALLVEGDAVLGAVDFERGGVQHVLILANFGVEFVDALVEAVLLAFLLLDGLRVLRLCGGEFSELLCDALGFSVELTGFSGEHLPGNSTHLVANFGVTARFRGLALERAELFFDFDDDIVHAREIEFGGLELGFGEALLGLKFGYACGFFNDGAAFHGLGGEDEADAALFDDGVGIRTEADTHEHFLNITKSADAAVDEIFALAGAVQAPRDHYFARLRGEDGFVSALFTALALEKLGTGGTRFLNLRVRVLRFCRFLLQFGGRRGGERKNLCVRVSLGECVALNDECDRSIGNALDRRALEDETGGFCQLGILHGDGHFGHAEGRALGRSIEDAIGHTLSAEGLVALLAENPGDGVNYVGFAATVGPDDAGGAGAAKGDYGAVTKRLKANDFYFSQLKQVVPFLSRFAPS